MTGFKLENLTVFEVELPEGVHSTPSPLEQALQVKVGIHAPATSYVLLHMVVRLNITRMESDFVCMYSLADGLRDRNLVAHTRR